MEDEKVMMAEPVEEKKFEEEVPATETKPYEPEEKEEEKEDSLVSLQKRLSN